jgi:outer membrane lipoprotein SlyB
MDAIFTNRSGSSKLGSALGTITGAALGRGRGCSAAPLGGLCYAARNLQIVVR